MSRHNLDEGDMIAADAVSELLEASRAVLREVSPYIRPDSTDSYIPDHLRERLEAALARFNEAPR